MTNARVAHLLLTMLNAAKRAKNTSDLMAKQRGAFHNSVDWYLGEESALLYAYDLLCNEVLGNYGY